MKKKGSPKIIRGKRTLTLFELFITMALLAFAGTLVILRALPMLEHYRFESDAKRFEKEIVLTKRIATIAHADVLFEISLGRKGILCTRLTDEPIRMPKSLNKKMTFPHLASLQLDGRVVEECQIAFTGSGWSNQRGQWELVSKHGERYKIPLMTLTRF